MVAIPSPIDAIPSRMDDTPRRKGDPVLVAFSSGLFRTGFFTSLSSSPHTIMHRIASRCDGAYPSVLRKCVDPSAPMF